MADLSKRSGVADFFGKKIIITTIFRYDVTSFTSKKIIYLVGVPKSAATIVFTALRREWVFFSKLQTHMIFQTSTVSMIIAHKKFLSTFYFIIINLLLRLLLGPK